MKKKSFLVPLLLCLVVFGHSRPGLAASWTQDSVESLERLEKEGWQEVSPGVLQRTRDGNQVETLGFGEEGLRFRIETLKADLAFLRQEYARHPSRELRSAIRAHRSEIVRSEAALRKADTDGALESASEAMTAWANDCPAQYAASAYAFPLAQGAGASASASFNNNCGYTGEVYVQTYSTASDAEGTEYSAARKDPGTAPSTPRFGANVTAAASIGVNGVQACYSSAYASVTTYDLGGITHSVSAQNGDSAQRNGKCSGNGTVEPFAADAASNLRLVSGGLLHPDSAEMVANLNSNSHKALLYEFGRPIYNASAGNPRTIVCTSAVGACVLSGQTVSINPGWKPASGSEGAMVVIDYSKRKIYSLSQVATNPDGTVKINADGTVTIGRGTTEDLDGNGQAGALGGSNLSYLFGTVRTFEMERAASNPENAIQHALAFTSQFTCPTWRYPATASDATSTSTACIPTGSRVFLDSSADCSIVSPAGEKAICYALQKYGAYAVGTGNVVFGIKFEVPTDGHPGGSGPDPYPGIGLTTDGYDLSHIPWSLLKVAFDCQCSSSNLTPTIGENGARQFFGRPFAERAASNVPLPSSPALDPNSSAMVASLNSGEHSTEWYAESWPIYDASAGTPRTLICTNSSWSCRISGQQVPINPSWKPSPLGTGSVMMVIDYTARKVYELAGVATNPDGTVVINSDGTVTSNAADAFSLDGNGHKNSLTFSNLFGRVRVFEMERAASNPENAIQHALGLLVQNHCATYRYPAPRALGTSNDPGCLPAGARVFLDSSADCTSVSPASEKAICYALKKYGAYVFGNSSVPFEILLEAPTNGIPGGSGPDPYPGQAYNMVHIPWSHLKVAADCQCTPY